MKFDGVKVFSATKARERNSLGDHCVLPARREELTKKFYCSWFQERPPNVAASVLCSGSGLWDRCDNYPTCHARAIAERLKVLSKEKKCQSKQ